jgi:cation diffusion facilitator family transporter
MTTAREIRAIQIAIACSIFGAIVKFSVGLGSHSMAMLASAVDSVGDLCVSAVNLFVVRLAARPADEEHNYGHAKVEGLGAMFEGGFIFSAGLFLLYEAAHKALIGEKPHDGTLGIVVMIPLLLVTGATVIYLRKVAAATKSMVIAADALHYLTDVYVNLGVLAALIVAKVTGWPYVDAIFSAAIAIFMVVSSVRVVREGLHVVMDGSLPVEEVRKVKELLESIVSRRIVSFHDFRTRGGRWPVVDFHVVVPGATPTAEIHELFVELQGKVRAIVGPETKVLMHADPVRDGAHPPRDEAI